MSLSLAAKAGCVLDIAPTVLDVLEIDVPAGMRGTSLLVGSDVS